MTETSTAATIATPEDFKFGTVGKPFPGCEVKIADDGEILVKGAEHLPGLLQERGGDPGDDRRRLAAHRRHRRDRPRRLPEDHRPQEGHHHHRGRQEHHPGEPRGRDQAAPAGLPVRGDRRPPPLPGRAGHARPRGGGQVRRASTGCRRPEALAANAEVKASIEAHVDKINEKFARVEQVKKIEILPARPLPGGRRADADDEGEAQRRRRQVRREDRRALRELGGATFSPTPGSECDGENEAAAVGGLVVAAAISGMLGSGSGPETASAGDAERPNVVVLMSDDQTQDSMRYMSRVRELIGAEGATFPTSVTNWPLCCPSRATFLTGQYAHNHGVLGNTAAARRLRAARHVRDAAGLAPARRLLHEPTSASS